MPFCHRIDQSLITPVLLQALFDFRVRGARALKIAFVHHHNVGKIEHHDFLQLQPAAVIRVHYQHSLIDNTVFLERHRLLASTHRLNDHVIEPGAREQRQTVLRRRGKSASLAACRHAAHEYAIVLRVDHGGPVAQQRSFADHARIV